jgi:hypothetical protein
MSKATSIPTPSALDELREHVSEAVNFLKTLANDQRLLILCTLLEGEQNVGELNEKLAPVAFGALTAPCVVARGPARQHASPVAINLLPDRRRARDENHGPVERHVLSLRRKV